ncbi:MAG: Ig-like domain-containing protein, partial [Crocinitomicaceae bacterium]|nr:Ig-like domain-containing protein [Crocinitomicaceae bacterium]
GNGCSSSANDNVEVFALPTVTFTASADLCIDAGVQAGLGGATPAGGVYSGTGVADDGNGTTYSFDPAAAGVGVHTIAYNYTDGNGCSSSANDNVEVFALPVIATVQTPITGCDSDDGIITVSGGGATGTVDWTGPSSGTSGSVTLPFNITPLAPGTYDVTFTDGTTGCVSIISQETFINPGAPVVSPLADYTACNIDFTLLNSNITGTLTGGQAYYTATGGPAGVGVLIPDGTVYSAPTNITVYAFDENGACASEQFFTITINALPTISGNTPICVNGTFQLTGSGTPDGTTPWASSNLAVATVDNTGLVTGIAAGTATITYLDANGCQITELVTVNGLPTISGNAPICATSTLQLTGSGVPDGTTPWTSSNTGVATVDNTGLVTAVAGGSTTITYLDVNGCQITDVIVVNDLPTISGNAAICIVAPLQLTGSGTANGTTPWTSSNLAVATVDNTGLVTGVSGGTTTITYTDINGCQVTELITVNATPIIDPINAVVVCDSYTLLGITGTDLTTAVSYWDATGGTGTQFAAGNVITGSMQLFIYDSNGACSAEENFTITVNITPVLDLILDTIVCDSYTFPTITGTDLTGNGAYYDDPQLNGGALTTGPITSTQTVWIYDIIGACSDETSYLVTITASPTGTISGGGIYCQGDIVNDVVVDLTGTSGWTINYTFDGNAQVATGSVSPIVLGNAPGTYVLVDLTDAICLNSITGLETITINPIPAAPFAGTDAEYCSTATLAAMTASGNGGTFNWYDDPGLIAPIGSGDSFTPPNIDGVNTFYVTETISGCEGPSSMVQITVADCEVLIPSAFTPNGDNAHNTWELPNLDSAYPNNIVRIYNRWGNILFESTAGDYNSNEWDGTFKGELMPVSSYYYIIELNDDEDETLTGTVTIILD